MAYQFLSDEWQDAAREIRKEFEGKATAPPHKVKMNLVVTDVPFGDGNVDAHMDTSSGSMELETGHLDDGELTVTLDYDTAKAILIDGNPQAGMQAFMAGKIKVQGDMTKLMAMQQTAPSPDAAELTKRLQEITE
ncbi:MAG: SCP2 sterol-binding domain-containing protein [Acidimicrobiales bacterium]